MRREKSFPRHPGEFYVVPSPSPSPPSPSSSFLSDLSPPPISLPRLSRLSSALPPLPLVSLTSLASRPRCVSSHLSSPRLTSPLPRISSLLRLVSPSCLISLAPCLSSPPLSCVSSRLYLLFTLQAVAHSSGWWSPSGLAIIICTMHPCSTTRAVNWGWVPSVAHVFGVLGWYGCCWWCWRGIAWVPVITPRHYLLWAASESVVYTPVCFGVWGGYCDIT